MWLLIMKKILVLNKNFGDFLREDVDLVNSPMFAKTNG